MNKDIKNKVVVITGGAQGIGYHIGDAFLQYGAKIVILLDIDKKSGNEAANSLMNKHGDNKAVYMKCDVAKDLDEISKKIFKNYKVDVLVNNAGICDETDVRKTIEINVISVLEWGFKFFEHMRADTGGHSGTILNVASIYAYDFTPWLPVYKTSKHGVVGFTKTLGHPTNYKKYGVRVIAICPGITRTAIITNFKPFDMEKVKFKKHTDSFIIQSADTVGKAAAQIFMTAESSTLWEIRDNKPIKEVKSSL